MYLRVKELVAEWSKESSIEVSIAYSGIRHRLAGGQDMQEGRKNLPHHGQNSHTSFD